MLIALHQIVGVIFISHGWKGMTASDWAAWVQAFGSTAAIAVAFAVANRQQRAATRDKKDADVRRIKSIRALYQNLLDMAIEARRAITGEEGHILGAEPWKHLNERRAAIQRLSIFDVPDEKIAIEMIPMPISLETLCNALNILWHQSDEIPPIENPVDKEVEAALGIVITRARQTIRLCDSYILKHS